MDKDTGKVAGTVALVLVLLVGAFYMACFAPCDVLGWMPVKDIPARCLTIGK
jgi:hypothetical protein